MGYNFKETMNKPERFAPGHRMCAGCGATICARNVLRGLHEGDKDVYKRQPSIQVVLPVTILHRVFLE